MTGAIVLTGKIISGAGQGAYFTQIGWVLQQCDEKLGFKPYPGTLNLEISEDDLPIIESLDQEPGIELVSPDPKFCNAKTFRVSLGKSAAPLLCPKKK